jgi:hypothetical protein
MTTQKWGAIASFILAATFIAAPVLNLAGPVEPAMLSYHDLADFLFGPLWAASLIMSVFALREQVGEHAPRRMTAALLASTLSGVMVVAAAIFRSTNRHYLGWHPEMDPTLSHTIFVAWITVVQGLISTGYHFLGWALLLLGSVGWTTRQFPRLLNVLYLVGGMVALFSYTVPGNLEGNVVLVGLIWSIWQGIFLWRADSREPSARVESHQPA